MNDLNAISEILSDLIKTAEDIDEGLLVEILIEAKREVDDALARKQAAGQPPENT